MKVKGVKCYGNEERVKILYKRLIYTKSYAIFPRQLKQTGNVSLINQIIQINQTYLTSFIACLRAQTWKQFSAVLTRHKSNTEHYRQSIFGS